MARSLQLQAAVNPSTITEMLRFWYTLNFICFWWFHYLELQYLLDISVQYA